MPQPTGRREQHRRLPERRQHAPDVPDEISTRPDDQHGAAGQPFAVGVEQVGDAVQRDGGLTCPRSALDDDDAGERQPDDGVLLAWIVVTMSRIVEPRGAFSAASNAGSEADPESVSTPSTSS